MNISEGQTRVPRLNVRGGGTQVTGECGPAELIAWECSRRGAPLGSAGNFMEQQELVPSSYIIFNIQTSQLMSPDVGWSYQNNPDEFIAWGKKIIYLRSNHPFNPHPFFLYFPVLVLKWFWLTHRVKQEALMVITLRSWRRQNWSSGWRSERDIGLFAC